MSLVNSPDFLLNFSEVEMSGGEKHLKPIGAGKPPISTRFQVSFPDRQIFTNRALEIYSLKRL